MCPSLTLAIFFAIHDTLRTGVYAHTFHRARRDTTAAGPPHSAARSTRDAARTGFLHEATRRPRLEPLPATRGRATM